MTKAKSIAQKVAEGMAHAQEVGECLEWQGNIAKDRQPSVGFRFPGKGYSDNVSVPRFLWERENGPIPAGKMVYRKCCNNACVRQDHLAVGKRADAIRARMKQGATKHSAATIMSITIKARKRTTTLNSLEKAKEVRLLAAEGLNRKEISERTGVSVPMVVDIRAGRAWRDLSTPFSGLFTGLASNDGRRAA